MNIYKNFLSKQDFKKIKSFIMGNHFPWYYSDGVIDEDDKYDQFVYTFIAQKGIINCPQNMLDLITPLLSKIKHKKYIRVKANLLLKTPEIVEQGYHIDQLEGETCVFYLNTCNGYTKFKNGKKIKSEENKLVRFKSTLEHTGSSCTDKKRRVVINFNYV